MDGDVVVGTTLSSSSFSSFSIARSMMGHVAGANRVVDLIDSILSMREKERERRRLMRMRRWSRDNREIEHYDDDVSVEDYDDDALRCITIFAFSTENWSRPKYEIDAIYELIENMSRKYRLYDRSIKDGKVRIRILGNIDDDRIPNRTRDELRMLERTSDEACDLMNSRKTGRRRRGGTMTTTSLENDDNDDRDDDDDALTVCLAINYGGRADILRAATELARSIVDDAASESNPSVIDETEITKRLCTSNLPDVDLIIRTGGERRLSNFFLWEGAYAELYFCDTLWPDFDEVSINEALAWYGKRKRRFGGR
jgi:undecaprenyl diphosphate synthase